MSSMNSTVVHSGVALSGLEHEAMGIRGLAPLLLEIELAPLFVLGYPLFVRWIFTAQLRGGSYIVNALRYYLQVITERLFVNQIRSGISNGPSATSHALVY